MTENKEVIKKVEENKAPEAQKTQTVEVAKTKSTDNKRKFNNRNNPRGRNNKRNFRRPQSEFEEKVIDIARVTTVVKGGRRFSFSAFVVIGNKKGKIGWGHGKAKEVPDAIKKAIKDAKNNVIVAPIIDGRTIPHDQQAKYLASKILIKPAPKGKGVIASGSIRAVVELAGYHDIYTKSLGSRSKQNSVKATIKALESLRTVETIAKLRDKTVKEIKG